MENNWGEKSILSWIPLKIFSLSGINKIHKGVELAGEFKLSNLFTVNAVAALGEYKWDSRPRLDISSDNTQYMYTENDTLYAKGSFEGGTPQTAYSCGIKYSGKDYLFIGVNANYLADNYATFSPVRRTASAVEGIEPGSEKYNQIVEQEKLPEMFTLDAYVGKSFRFQHKYYLSINLTVSNVLNNKTLITSGYEQLRLGASTQDGTTDVTKFTNKYYYYFGASYFLNISFRF